MLPDAAELQRLLPRVSEIAEQAGAAILAVYETTFAATEKADRSPLTEADLAAHRVIMAGLEQLTPNWPILSEEGRGISYAERHAWPCFWLVDPLDGTREFIKRNGEFTVNIALVVGHQPVLGVVYRPVNGLLYSGIVGVGAVREDPTDGRRPIHAVTQAQDPLRVVASRSHGSDRLEQALAQLGPHERVSMGSSLKLCLVAEGSADLYPRLGPTSEWDTAAAHAVVAAAGGRVCDLSGEDLRYNQRESLLNPEFLVCAGDPVPWLEQMGVLEQAP